MGDWGTQPWDNDAAADWFSRIWRERPMRTVWLEGISGDPEEDYDTIRAAAWLFIQLGYLYVWPAEEYFEDLERTIEALKRVQACEEYAAHPDLRSAVGVEVAELKERGSRYVR